MLSKLNESETNKQIEEEKTKKKSKKKHLKIEFNENLMQTQIEMLKQRIEDKRTRVKKVKTNKLNF